MGDQRRPLLAHNFAQGLLLNPGSYEVKIVPVNGTGEVTKTVTIVANQIVVVQ